MAPAPLLSASTFRTALGTSLHAGRSDDPKAIAVQARGDAIKSAAGRIEGPDVVRPPEERHRIARTLLRSARRTDLR